jgi:RNA polymerase sigma-70 factor (ECF subfamily)
MPETKDSQLLEGIRKKDRQAFRELVERYQTMVINTANGFTHNLQDAEDIAQEVFMEVYRSAGRFRGKSSFSTWIYRITVNRALNHVRDNRLKKYLTGMSSAFGATDGNVVGNPPVSDHKTDQALENEETKQAITKALDKLPKSQRIAFVLHKYEELSYKDIAGVMGTSLASIESLIHRARINLQKRLLKHYKDQ